MFYYLYIVKGSKTLMISVAAMFSGISETIEIL